MLNNLQRLRFLEHLSEDELLALSLLITMLEHEAENGSVDYFPMMPREPGDTTGYQLNVRVNERRIGRDHSD